MKKILLALTIVILSFIQPQIAFAQNVEAEKVPGEFYPDSEVTFVGKTATRANDFLNWTLRNYDWLCMQRNDDGSCDNSGNPLTQFWLDVARIPFAFLLLFVLAGAFVIIITRGQNIKLKQFIPRLMFIVVLMILSYAIVTFLYILTDIFQGQFLTLNHENREVIQSDDLLFIDFRYDFQGFRRAGMQYEESAYVSLLLVKLTAITYYVMTGILIVRKIILWFFLIISSIFPLLLFYRPLRNTAKLWVGEFFRWLLYAPLFAVFLRGLVEMWRNQIPLPFDLSAVATTDGMELGPDIYTTSISILLAGPGLVPTPENSVNLPDTFALYVVALIMLWVVIILPFLLLKIFLDYINTISLGQNPVVQRLNRRFNIFNPPPTRGPSPTGPAPDPSKPQPAGQARALPFLHRPMGTASRIETKKSESSVARRTENIATRTQENIATRRTENITNRSNISSNTRNVENVRKTSEVLKNANIEIPKMRDIARFETQMISRDKSTTSEVSRFHDTLKQIASPATSTTTTTNIKDREKINTVRETLTKEKEQGNPIAQQVLSAAKVATQVNVQAPAARMQAGAMGSTGAQGAQGTQGAPGTTGQPGATGMPGATPQATFGPGVPALPVVNTTQQVSLEDYEEVRKMWVENYKTLEPPASIEGGAPTREEWIKEDEHNIDQAVTLLTSPDKQKVDQGMEMVANILPFLLIGGFSKSEVVAYLKAKKEAGKTVLEDMSQKKEEEDTLLDRQEGTQKEEAQMEMKRELPTEDDKKNDKQAFPDTNEGSTTDKEKEKK